MIATIHQHITPHGRLNRLGFLYASLGIITVGFLLGYIFAKYTQITGDTSFTLLTLKSTTSILLLAIWSPFIIRRLHDIGLSGWFCLLFWLTIPFESRNVAIAQIMAKHPIESLSSASHIIQIIMLCVWLLLLLVPGLYWANKYNNPNKSLNRIGADTAPPG